MIKAVFCFTECNPSSNSEGGNEQPSNGKDYYEITLDASKVSVDTNKISVGIYSLDGTLVGEKKISKGKTRKQHLLKNL